jgi:CheY-like chemotaxis protein
LKILLVEDNILNQKVVSFHLRKRHYEVFTATNWVEAMKIFKNEYPDLIFMDIMLPEKDGYEIAGEIRKIEYEEGKNTQIPIIALTANTLDNDRKKCLKAGMNDYLSKPFTAQDLYRAIDKLIINS